MIDFTGMTLSPVTLSYSGFASNLTISASEITAQYAGTGPSAPAPYAGSDFELLDLPTALAGTANATGSIFGVASINEMFDLGAFPEAAVPSFAGKLTNTGGDSYALNSSFTVQTTQPFDAGGFVINITVDITAVLAGTGTGVTAGPTPCNAADFSEAFGTLDINDVLAYGLAFNEGDPAADLFPAGGDGNLDINDVLEFGLIFNGGCP
jgi:hypothetical protein